MVKAKLLRICETLALTKERRISELLYSHNLTGLLNEMPAVEAEVEKRGQWDGKPYRTHLRQICTEWTIFARYSPRQTDLAPATVWLSRIRALKEVLR